MNELVYFWDQIQEFKLQMVRGWLKSTKRLLLLNITYDLKFLDCLILHGSALVGSTSSKQQDCPRNYCSERRRAAPMIVGTVS